MLIVMIAAAVLIAAGAAALGLRRLWLSLPRRNADLVLF